MKSYSFHDWILNTEVLKSEEQMRAYFSALNLIDRKIKNIKFAGLVYSCRKDEIEIIVFSSLEKCSSSLAKFFSDFDKIPDDFKFDRYAEIDEPFILTLDDGRNIELCADELDNEFYVSVNEVNIKDEVNICGNILFSSCLDKTITGIDFKEEYPPNDVYDGADKIPALILYLSDGSFLQFNGEIDFCEVSHRDKNGQEVPICFKQLKQGLKE